MLHACVCVCVCSCSSFPALTAQRRLSLPDCVSPRPGFGRRSRLFLSVHISHLSPPHPAASLPLSHPPSLPPSPHRAPLHPPRLPWPCVPSSSVLVCSPAGCRSASLSFFFFFNSISIFGRHPPAPPPPPPPPSTARLAHPLRLLSPSF